MRLLLLPLLAFPWISSPAGADLLVGKVVGPGGAPVAGVNIDAVDQSTGNDVLLANDSTDANGDFQVTIPAGVYTISFLPPPPPASTAFALDVPNVVVSGTANLGTVALEAGVVLSGTVRTSSGAPVAGLDVDVRDLATGLDLYIAHDKTDSSGQFAVPCVLGDVELELKANKLGGAPLVSQDMVLAITGNESIGIVTLQPGHIVVGRVLTQGGAPVAGADLDAMDVATGIDVYTPGDNTDAQGDFELIVPAGTFDFDVCPQLASSLAVEVVEGVAVSSGVDLGNITLSPGVLLSGVIRDTLGAPVPGADVDLSHPVTGADVPICGEHAGLDGSYAFTAPVGTWDVSFEPAGYDLPLGADVHPAVSLFSPATIDGALPPCPFLTNYGGGTAGTGGKIPRLKSSGGAPRVGNDAYAFVVKDALGGAFVALLLSNGKLNQAYLGGKLLIDPTSMLPLLGAASPSGEAGFPLPVAITAELVGLSGYAQAFVLDPGAIQGVSMSRGGRVDFCL
jgi:hypothetical protein